ncbi:MAG TPA: DNA polymerase III subunit delta [Steroidobacteraceae bacterium]|nr:DNA polymerase III subunit delta [Steroidobacteraceae bacterium]
MRLTADTLARQLSERLLPVYLLSGDEPLLASEALDAIRARARALGFEEREQVFIERAAAVWEQALSIARNQSLFASRRILEVRMASGKPGAGASALLRLIAAAGDELLLIIVTGKLDRDAAGADWVREVQERGAWLALWPPPAARYPEWLQQRLGAAGLTLSTEALGLLAACTEGNLLAAQQEIDKLLLRFGGGAKLSLEQLAEAAGENARFEVAALSQAIAAGDAVRALRVLAALRAEGDEPVRILWWLVRALHGEARVARTVSMSRLVARAALADRVAKGLAHGEAWDVMALLVAEMCGLRTLPLPRAASLPEPARA